MFFQGSGSNLILICCPELIQKKALGNFKNVVVNDEVDPNRLAKN